MTNNEKKINKTKAGYFKTSIKLVTSNWADKENEKMQSATIGDERGDIA